MLQPPHADEAMPACGGRTIGPGLSARCGACGGFNVNGALKGVFWDFNGLFHRIANPYKIDGGPTYSKY